MGTICATCYRNIFMTDCKGKYITAIKFDCTVSEKEIAFLDTKI